MEGVIDEILQDLYAIDNSLMKHEEQLKKAIQKLIESRPDVSLDDDFKLKLRNELLAKADELQRHKPVWRRMFDAISFIPSPPVDRLP